MKLRKPNSPFYRWWNSYSGKRLVSATYSLGAAVVIMGAMFKILHLPMGNYMLGFGMTVESLIFALGIFDKPYREYDWSRVFNFKGDDSERLSTSNLSAALSGQHIISGTNFQSESAGTVTDSPEASGPVYITSQGQGGGVIDQSNGGGVVGHPCVMVGGVMLPNETLAEEDVKRLSEGIKNLTETAEQLQLLANVAVAANGLAHNIESASEIAATFADTQLKLNNTAESLTSSYQNVNSEVNKIVTSTHGYSGNVESVNRTLISINSIYEIQLRHLQAQTENLNRQAEAIKQTTEHVDGVATDMDKMKEAATLAQIESQRYQAATRKLSKQVEDLNGIYGNMLNALS